MSGPPLCLSAPIWVTRMVQPGDRSRASPAAGGDGGSSTTAALSSHPVAARSQPSPLAPSSRSAWLQLIPAPAWWHSLVPDEQGRPQAWHPFDCGAREHTAGKTAASRSCRLCRAKSRGGGGNTSFLSWFRPIHRREVSLCSQTTQNTRAASPSITRAASLSPHHNSRQPPAVTRACGPAGGLLEGSPARSRSVHSPRYPPAARVPADGATHGLDRRCLPPCHALGCPCPQEQHTCTRPPPEM